MSEGALSVQTAWNSVALDERLELISRCKARGLVAGTVFILMVGSIAYGFDEIWLLGGGSVFSIFVMQLFASYGWRSGKPDLILKYLAVRSVARRYAYGYRMPDLDVVLIFRGRVEELFDTEEHEVAHRQFEDISLKTDFSKRKRCWIVLMRGSLVVLTERRGGAKLEFISQIGADTVVTDVVGDDNLPDGALLVEGNGITKGRKVALMSEYNASFYVFEKQLKHLILEAQSKKASLEALPTSLD